MPVPEPRFSHLHSLTGPHGTFEHAEYTFARVEHGYCTDDVSRVLLVASREPDPDSDLIALASSSLDFLSHAQGRTGKFRNRRDADGSWSGPRTADDCWGRAMWALGTTVARSPREELRREALRLFERGARQRSTWPRSMAFAVLGAAEVLDAIADHGASLALVSAAATVLDRPGLSPDWQWPEDRLTYANAVLPEATMLAGSILGRGRLVEAGLRQLAWLLALETRDGHLSVTPAGGRGREGAAGRFDQQPIEVAALSDACVRAFELTGDGDWLRGHELAVRWFMGENDLGVMMFDPRTGGGYDGLMAHGPNLNQGAESTIAVLTTLQNARRLARAAL
ncbi:MAG: glycosyltransferase [Acidobacteriota bacterium]|nr:glycosyltransferase [Acidobacteriota bacterium]